jgi:hypothetical protein
MSLSRSAQKTLLLAIVALIGLPLCASPAAGQTAADSRAWSRVRFAPGHERATTDVPVVRYSSLIVRRGLPPTDSPDIQITTLPNTTQSENSVFVSPLNDNIILNSNNSSDYPVTQIFGASGFVSTDGGLTWNGSVNGTGGTNDGDPAVAIGLNGRFYNNYIAADGGNGTAYSTNGGATWTHVQVAPNPGGLADKNHLWVDNSPLSPYANNLYAAWTDFGGTFDSQIMVARSTNAGLTWSPKTAISTAIAAGSHNQGVNIQTGPNGEVYAAWAVYDAFPAVENAIGFASSTNGGATWQPAVRAIQGIKGIRSQTTEGGLLGGKDMRTASFPSMSVNMQNGHIYMVWTNIGIPGVNTGTERDVYIVKSTDDGATWGPAVRVNQDPPGNGKDQWSPWLSCDPVTGFLVVVFYDSRDFPANDMANTYVAVSRDDGATWEDFRVSDAAWSGDGSGTGFGSNYAGDYIGIAARNGRVYPVWTDRRASGGRLSTWASPFLLADPIDPMSPTGVRAFSDFATPTSIALTWTNPTTLVNGTPIPPFVVRILRDGVQIAETPATDSSYHDPALLEGTFYSYTLLTRLLSNDSLSSGVQTGWTAGGARRPSTPRSLTARGTPATGYTIRWTNPSTQIDGTRLDDLAGLRLYRDASFVGLVARTPLDTGRVDSTLDMPPPGLHSYSITAVDNETPVNESAPSNTAFTPLGVPFVDTFPVQGTPNAAIWTASEVEVNDLAVGEPSAPYAMNLNGNPSGGDTAVVLHLDLAGQQDSGAVLAFMYQPRGTGENPDPEDSLFVEFENDLGNWIRAASFAGLSTSDSLPPFAFVSIAPSTVAPGSGTFFYNGFRFRFRTKSTMGLYDDWFIDDVFFGVPSGNPNMVVAPQSIGDTLVVGNTDSSSYLFSIANNNPFARPLAFTVQEDPDAPWLSAQPPTGSVSANSSTPVRLAVDFAGVSPGSYATRLIVSGNDTLHASDTVNITFVVNPPPQIGVTPDSLLFTLNEGDSTQATMTITNTGSGPLAFSLRHELETSRGAKQALAVNPPAVDGIEGHSRSGEAGPYPPVLHGPGLDEPVIFSPSGIADKRQGRWGRGTLPLTGGKLYGVAADSIFEIDLTTGQIVSGIRVPITTSAGPTGLAFSGSRLYLADAYVNTSIYVLNPADGTVITSYAAPSGSTDGLAFVDGKLYATNYIASLIYEMNPENGQVIRTITPGATVVGGIDGGRGRLFATNYSSEIYELDINTGAVLHSFPPVASVYGVGFTGDRLFTSIPGSGIDEYDPETGQYLGRISMVGFAALAGGTGAEWLSESPTAGIVPPGGSQDIAVRIRTDELDGGTLRAGLLVSSNDPETPLVTVPLRLTVIGTPNLVLSDDTLAFANAFVGYPDTLALEVSNNGSDTLRVSGISSGNPLFTLLGSTVFTLAPRGTRAVQVEFLPTAVGPQTGLLTIASNDPSDPAVTVILTGTGTEPPQISVIPDSLGFTVNEGDSAAAVLAIGNSGLGPLSWQTSIVSGAGATLWALPAVQQTARRAEGESREVMVDLRTRVALLADLTGKTIGITNQSYYGILAGDLASRGATVRSITFPINQALLDSMDVIAVDDAIGTASPADLIAIQTWLQNGGALLLQGDDTGSITNLNTLLAGSGIAEISLGGYDDAVLRNILSHPSTQGVDTINAASYGAYCTVNAPAEAIVFDQLSRPHVAVSTSGQGRIMAVGNEVGDDYNIPLGDTRLFANQIFDWLSSAGSFLSVTPDSGVVASGGAQTLEAKVRTEELDGGTYHAGILVASNDPATPIVTVPVRLTVLGTPNLVLSEDTLDFGEAFVGYPDTVAFQVSNNGSDTLRVSGISSGNPVFAALGSTVFTVAPRGARTVGVQFLPAAAGPETGVLTITSNDPGDPAVTVSLAGTGTQPPHISVTPDSLAFTVNEGDSAATPLMIANAGLGPLSFRIDLRSAGTARNTKFPVGPHAMSVASPDQRAPFSAALNQTPDPSFVPAMRHLYTGSQMRIGISDSAEIMPLSSPLGVEHLEIGSPCSGYTLAYSDGVTDRVHWSVYNGRSGTLSGVSYTEIEDSPSRTVVEAVLRTTDGRMEIRRRFSFVKALRAVALRVWIRNISSSVLTSVAFKEDADWDADGDYDDDSWSYDSTHNMIYASDLQYMAIAGRTPPDLATRDGWNYYTQRTTVDNRTPIAQFDGFEILHYDLGDLAPGEEQTLDFVYAVGTNLADLQHAVDNAFGQLVDWLSVTPLSGGVTPGGSQEVMVKVRSDLLDGGNYGGNILVNSNDPLQPVVTVPVRLTVIGTPNLVLSDDTLTFGEAYVGYPDTLALEVSNNGSDTLRIAGVNSGNPVFTPLGSTVFTVAPGGAHAIQVRFLPVTAGMQTGQLTISSNDPGDPVVAVLLAGAGIEPPHIAVAPDSLSFAVNQGDSATATMTITNSGPGVLRWHASFSTGARRALYTLPAARRSVRLTESGEREAMVDFPPRPSLLTDLTGRHIGITSLPYYSILVGDLTLRGAIVRQVTFPIDQALLDSLDVIAVDDAVSGAGSSDLDAMRAWLQTGKALLLQGDDAITNLNALLPGSGIVEIGLGTYYDATLTDIQDHPSTRDVDTINASSYAGYFVVNLPATTIVYDNLSRPHVAVSVAGSGRIVAVGNEVCQDYNLSVGDTRLFANQVFDWLGFAGDFLSITPDSGTVASGGGQAVDVKVRTGGLDGRTYFAGILVGSNDPLHPAVTVPVRVDVLTDVALAGDGLPAEFALSQNYPNPFNPSTTIEYDIPRLSQVTLKVFDILGREVAVLVSERVVPGRYRVAWDTRGVSSGVYLYRLQAHPVQEGEGGSYSMTRKMVLLR